MSAVALQPRRALVAAGGSDRTARVWDAATGEPVAVLHGHEEELNSVAFVPGSRTIVTGGADRTARLWRLPLNDVLDGSRVRATASAFNADGSRVAIAGANGRVVVWDTGSGRQVADVRAGHVDSMSLSLDGARVFTLDQATGTARMRSTRTPDKPLVLDGSEDPALAAAFDPGGNSLALGFGQGAIRVLDLAHRTSRELHTAGDEAVVSLAFSPDGRRLAAGTFPAGQTTVFDAATGARIVRTQTSHEGLTSLAFSDDGIALVSAGGGRAQIRTPLRARRR